MACASKWRFPVCRSSERLAAAAKAGFRYVEMWFVDGSFRGTGEELAAMAKRHRVKITNTVIGAPDGSIGGGLTDPANRRQWLDRARMTLAFNQAAAHPGHDRLHGQRRSAAAATGRWKNRSWPVWKPP